MASYSIHFLGCNGTDYTPWLMDAPVGEVARVRAAAVTQEGILAV